MKEIEMYRNRHTSECYHSVRNQVWNIGICVFS